MRLDEDAGGDEEDASAGTFAAAAADGAMVGVEADANVDCVSLPLLVRTPIV